MRAVFQDCQVIEAVNLFRTRVIDVSTESLTIEATGTQEKLDVCTGSDKSGFSLASDLGGDREGRSKRGEFWRQVDDDLAAHDRSDRGFSGGPK